MMYIIIFLIVIGAGLLATAIAMWSSSHKYPEAIPPTDSTEQAIIVCLAVLGSLMIAMGWWL